jgi:hypothetical protein
LNTVQEVFRAAFAGEISVEDADARVRAIQAANGAAPSAHDVATGEVDAGGSGSEAGVSDGTAAPVAYNPSSGIDPTPEQYAALTARQLVVLERQRPGVGDRIQGSEDWDALAGVEADRAAEVARVAEYDQRFGSDEAFRNSELARMSREQLDTEWWTLPITARHALAADAGLSAKEFEELATAKDSLAAGNRPTTVTGGF